MSLILLGILNSQAAAAGGAGAYDLIQTVDVTANTASINFTGLSALTDYDHLQVRATMRTSLADFQERLAIRFNDITSTTYAMHEFYSTGSAPSSTSLNGFSRIRTQGGNVIFANNEVAYRYTPGIFDVYDFRNVNKTNVIRWKIGSSFGSQITSLHFGSGMQTTAEALDKLTFYGDSGGSWVPGVRFSLYGIKAA